MSVTGALTNLGRSIIGNPRKALLILHKDVEQKLDSAKIAEKTAKVMEAVSKLETAGSAAVSAAMATQGLTGYHVLQVQYNPSSLSVNASAVSTPTAYLQQNLDNGIPNSLERPPSIVLSVELLFDAVLAKDAFMFDKLRLSTSDVAQAGIGIYNAAHGGYTVQPQTNGLVGMLMRDSTRTVTFKWADVTFTGEVNEVQARYTMFSPSGKPVRSVVRLNIMQQVDSDADTKYWDKAFDKCFGDDFGLGGAGGKSGFQKASNLVNVAF